jgi:hypothetical protein
LAVVTTLCVLKMGQNANGLKILPLTVVMIYAKGALHR